MSGQEKMMGKFDFLLGNWILEYRVPKSAFSPAITDTGHGRIKRALADQYVYFDYSSSFSNQTTGEAHGIFAWDCKAGIYRYWWFEDSGNFLSATCNFINDKTLFLNWHDTLLIQTFTKAGPNKVVLRMEHPAGEGRYKLVMEVILTRE